MPLKIIDEARKSLGFRLTLWYSAIFILSSLVICVVCYVFLSTSLRDNRKAIESKVRQYVAIEQKRGIGSVEYAASLRQGAKRRKSFFVRILDNKGQVVFVNSSHLWERFNMESVLTQPGEGAWQYVPSNGDVLELATARLANGYILQVGRTLEDREEILENYRETIVAVTIPMVLIALAGGTLFAFRAVRPIRSLIETTQRVVETGRVDVRVPETNASGELDQLVKLFNRMLDRVEGLLKAMREALDNVAHDLRTPMTRLRGTAEMALQGDSATQQYHESLATCVEESDRILTLLNSLMDISEAETGTMRLHLETVSVRELIHQVIDLYQYVAEDKDIDVKVDCANDMHIMADHNRMREVLANLLDNAIKYTSPSGTIIIEARKEKEQVIIRVKDTGSGIPSNEIARIWDRLHRGDKSRSQPGLGLGLSLVKAVVEAHKGRVEVQSELGVGSVFTIYLFMGAPGISNGASLA